MRALQALISRDYRGDVEMGVIDKFLPLVMDNEEEGAMSPILIHEKVTFVYIKHNNLYRILITFHYLLLLSFPSHLSFWFFFAIS